MGRTTILDQEKSIQSSFREAMEFYSVLLDVHHVKKNILTHLGWERSTGPSLHGRKISAPCVEDVVKIKRQYGEKSAYFQKFRDEERYRAHSKLQDLVVTLQGAEIGMYIAFQMHIRAVRSYSMLKRLVKTLRSKFLGKKRNALSCNNPVPQNVKRYIDRLILKGREYKATVVWVQRTIKMEATVLSR